jgi:predicted PhzF superfamily epimerase YddE/YHI9
MRLPIYQVDAFTDRVFAGNPAAVVPLETWLPDATLQAIAAENNLSETAYLVREGDGFHLRWFTPTIEVDLCGHATLASAWVLFNQLGLGGDRVAFRTLSGTLTVNRAGERLTMDFPARPPVPVQACQGLLPALGAAPAAVLASTDYLVVYDDPAVVAGLQPDMAGLLAIDKFAVIVTAPGRDGVDFVSRFFAPAKGVPEDPVTGRAHCTLTPYWAARLGKTRLAAAQVSARGGRVDCELAGDRVFLTGTCAFYLAGHIHV